MAELGRRLSAAEYRDWHAYYLLEPWGSEVEEDRVTLLFNAMMTNAIPKWEWMRTSQVFVRDEEDVREHQADLQDAQLRASLMGYNARFEEAAGGETPPA